MSAQIGSGAPFDVLGFVRRMIPFSHAPFRNGQKDGRGQQLIATFASPNADTTFTLALGHVPGEYVEESKSVAGVVYNGSNQKSDWTPNAIVLRASVAGTYHLWVA